MNDGSQLSIAPRAEAISDEMIARECRAVEVQFGTEAWKKLDEIETAIEALPQLSIQQHHVFTPGLYCREVLISKGTLLTTRIHLTEHPFVISAGIISVWTDEEGAVTLFAPHTGVTKPGTRRIIFAHTDCVFSTFHVTDLTDPDEIVKKFTYSAGKYADLGAAKAQPMLKHALD